MTAQSKTVIKSYFETGDVPTQAQFSDLVDSYQDASLSLSVLSSASVGTFGVQMLATVTTAQAVNLLGGVGDMTKAVYDSANISQQLIGVSAAQTLFNKTLVSPALTGSPTAPTQTAADNSTKIATTAYADALVPAGSTYTATLTPSGSGSITVNTSFDTLSYEEFGNKMVHVHGFLNVSSVSSPVGDLRISLPYTIATLTEGGGFGTALVVMDNTLSANAGVVPATIQSGQNYIRARNNSATALTSTLANQVQAGTELYVSVTFRKV